MFGGWSLNFRVLTVIQFGIMLLCSFVCHSLFYCQTKNQPFNNARSANTQIYLFYSAVTSVSLFRMVYYNLFLAFFVGIHALMFMVLVLHQN